MECICKNCNHWNREAPIVENKSDVGECERLGHISNVNTPEFILPVINNGAPVSKGNEEIEYITVANFGCNQFSAAA